VIITLRQHAVRSDAPKLNRRGQLRSFGSTQTVSFFQAGDRRRAPYQRFKGSCTVCAVRSVFIRGVEDRAVPGFSYSKECRDIRL